MADDKQTDELNERLPDTAATPSNFTSVLTWNASPEDLRVRLVKMVAQLVLVRAEQGRPRLKEIWLDRIQWKAVCDYFEKRGVFATSMSCLVRGVWLRPQGDKIAAKASEPLVVQEI